MDKVGAICSAVGMEQESEWGGLASDVSGRSSYSNSQNSIQPKNLVFQRVEELF